MPREVASDQTVRSHRRALRLEYFTVGWNVLEAVVAIGAGIIAGSVALIGSAWTRVFRSSAQWV